VFTLPDPIIPPEAARIMSLRDGTAKMSKSDPSDMSRINLTDDADDDHEEGEEGQDRSRTAAERGGGAGRHGPKRRTW
jgi:tryptophanyl-tRNA synthetase